MSKYEVILFDLDGTLTDPQEGITKSVQFALRKFGIVEEELAKLIPFIGPPLYDSFRESYGFSDTDARQAIIYYREYFTEKGMYQNAVYPGIAEMLRTLARQNKLLAIATSKPTVYSEQILKHFGLYDFFKLVVGSNLDGTRVAKTEVIAYVLQNLETAAKESTIMVGDRKHDIIGAQNNGIDSIAAGFGYGTPEELQAAGPTYLAESVEQLSGLLL